MIVRTNDGSALRAVMEATPALTHINCDIEEWAAKDENIALTDGNGNFGVFEFERPGIYTGHYFFENARGRAALDLSATMLRHVFDACGVQLVRGLTPTHHRAAVWLTRQLGFTDHGVIDTLAGPCHIFTLTKDTMK